MKMNQLPGCAPRRTSFLICFGLLLVSTPLLRAADELHTFDQQALTDTYFSESANAGDINGDGQDDVVCGPYWFAGPAFTEKHEIYAAKPQNRDAYANNFFSWIYDFDKDGNNDIFVVGFPGTPAYVYQNPGKQGLDSHWEKHRVFDSVANESPHFVDIVGDERPELVCTNNGFFGYATIDWKKPFDKWTFHAISDPNAPKQFGHGLGVGDVNADGRQDLIMKDGWFEQPASLEKADRWVFHAVPFAPVGGAEMYAYDVDGDGDNDVITSLEAHEFGLAWHEQVTPGEFRQHVIMGSKPEQNRYGLVFTEPHSVAVADIDGDGLKDIVTGKTYWSHHRQSPMWDAGAVVYWFRLVRDKDGVDWVPYLAAADPGIGRQVIVRDVNADGLLDIVLGGMKGCHVLTHKRESVTPEQWKAAQPKPYDGPKTSAESRPRSPIDAATGKVAGALEAEAAKILHATAGQAKPQSMSRFRADRWSGDAQLFWTGAKPGDRLDLELPVESDGVVRDRSGAQHGPRLCRCKVKPGRRADRGEAGSVQSSRRHDDRRSQVGSAKSHNGVRINCRSKSSARVQRQ